MKSAYVLSLACCLLATGSAMPAIPLQYQDSYGQYSFGYSSPTSARSEVRTLDGVTRGAYSYIDDAGFIQTAHYIADNLGFRIIAPNIPQTPVYIPPPQELKLVQLENQKIDQTANRGEIIHEQLNLAATKEVKQEAGVTSGSNQQGTNLDIPLRRIGATNVFLQLPSGEASGEKQSVIGDVPETKIGENNSSKSSKEVLESLSTGKKRVSV